MATTRRNFLTTAGGCVAHVLLNASCSTAFARNRWTAPLNPTVITTPFARLDAIGQGAWALISTPLGGDRTTFANGGIIAGRSGVVVVEGFYRTAGAEWMAQQARALTGRWPTHVVITHYHVDHASGVDGFPATNGVPPRIHITATTRSAALSGSPVAPARSDALARAYADVVVTPSDRVTQIDLGDRLLLLEPTVGHTSSDLVIHEPDASITYSGDLMWNGMFPNYIDANPVALRQYADVLSARLTRPTHRLVPGHGAVTDAAAMRRYVGLLDSIEDAARRGHAAGRKAQEVAASYTVPAALGEWMASRTSIDRAMLAWWRVLGAD